MWYSEKHIARLESDLKEALRRAEAAEDRLDAERQRHDWMVLQLSSRVVTKHGGYGLDHEPPKPPDPHPKGFTHEPTQEDFDVLNFFKASAADAGKSEQDAIDKWEAHMRGEDIYTEQEM